MVRFVPPSQPNYLQIHSHLSTGSILTDLLDILSYHQYTAAPGLSHEIPSNVVVRFPLGYSLRNRKLRMGDVSCHLAHTSILLLLVNLLLDTNQTCLVLLISLSFHYLHPSTLAPLPTHLTRLNTMTRRRSRASCAQHTLPHCCLRNQHWGAFGCHLPSPSRSSTSIIPFPSASPRSLGPPRLSLIPDSSVRRGTPPRGDGRWTPHRRHRVLLHPPHLRGRVGLPHRIAARSLQFPVRAPSLSWVWPASWAAPTSAWHSFWLKEVALPRQNERSFGFILVEVLCHRSQLPLFPLLLFAI